MRKVGEEEKREKAEEKRGERQRGTAVPYAGFRRIKGGGAKNIPVVFFTASVSDKRTNKGG